MGEALLKEESSSLSSRPWTDTYCSLLRGAWQWRCPCSRLHGFLRRANAHGNLQDIGRAQAIQYSDLNYSPREGEVRTYLTDWANYRYTINRETISKKYPMNYYFLSMPLANQYMGEDNAAHLSSQVLANQIEQSDVEVDGVTITSMSQETVKGATIARGTALVNITRIYSPRNSRQPRKEHWVLSVTYYLDPAQVSRAAQTFPQYETINPLGLTITEFHENRLSVEPIDPAAPQQTTAAPPVPGVPVSPRPTGSVR